MQLVYLLGVVLTGTWKTLDTASFPRKLIIRFPFET